AFAYGQIGQHPSDGERLHPLPNTGKHRADKEDTVVAVAKSSGHAWSRLVDWVDFIPDLRLRWRQKEEMCRYEEVGHVRNRNGGPGRVQPAGAGGEPNHSRTRARWHADAAPARRLDLA